MVFFHKYFIYIKKFPDIFTKYLSCFTCLFLALKVCDCLMPFDHLIKNFLRLLFKIQNINPVEINEKIIKETKERVFQIEFEILDLIGFDLNIDMPYTYLQKMSNYFINCIKAEKLIFCTTSFLNDSFKLPLSLYYDPLLILLACIYLCEFYFNVKLIDYQGVKWYQIIDKNVDFGTVKEIFLKMKFNYDYSSTHKHLIDLEFKKKELINKSLLEFDSSKIFTTENRNINNIEHKKFNQSGKDKNFDEIIINKEMPKIEKIVCDNIHLSNSKDSLNKEVFNSTPELCKVKENLNINLTLNNIDKNLNLDLNEEEREILKIKNKNKENKFKKMKKNDENIPIINEKGNEIDNIAYKNQVIIAFLNNPLSVQESNFLMDVIKKSQPEWPEKKISLENNA